MPELDYAFIAEHVRIDGPFGHALAIGGDTIIAPTTPTGQNIGLLFRIGFTRNECGRPHRVEVIFQDEDGERLAQIASVVTPEWTEGLPLHWLQGVMTGLNFGVPLPRYGLYSFEIMVNDGHQKTVHLRVVPPAGEHPPDPQ